MNLNKLLEIQEVLDNRIYDRFPDLKDQDNLDWKILALQVELGELANEWRGFKKWSEDQEPRTEAEVKCILCKGTGDLNYETVQEDAEGRGNHEHIDCEECNCTGILGVKNPLLEEYVDCLHFILSIGLEIGIRPDELKDLHIWNAYGVSQFNSLFSYASELYMFYWSVEYTKEEMKAKYINLLEGLLGLGIYGLGFTCEQIEQAYTDKNKINHERQVNGY